MYKCNLDAVGTDSDRDQRAGNGTIGSVLAGSDLTTLSDGEFDVTYLTKYQHRRELDECCDRAVEELADQPYDGRASCARVMGRAMELLRETYGLDAPRGWVPVLRALRAKEGAGPSRQNAGYQLQSEPSKDIWVVHPQDILTDPFSALHAMTTGPRLYSFVADRQDLKSRFVELAEKVGVPQSWDEALSFLEFLTEQNGEVPEPLSESLIELRKRVSEYECPHIPRPVEQRIARLRAEIAAIP